MSVNDDHRATREALAELATIEARTGHTPQALQDARAEFWGEVEHFNQSHVPIPAGTFIAIDLTANNAHCYPDHDTPPDFGWGVCKHGRGLQEFGDGYMVESVARARAQALNEGKQATDIPNVSEAIQ
jgi:hypothetical protein